MPRFLGRSIVSPIQSASPRRPRSPRVGMETLDSRVLLSGGLTRVTGVAEDASASVGVTVVDVTVLTTSSGLRRAEVTVELDSPLRRPATFRFQTQDGSAISGRDYQARAGVVRFSVGKPVAVISVPIAATESSASNRVFTVNVAGLLNGRPIRVQGNVTINNQADSEDRPGLRPIETATELYEWRSFQKALSDPDADPNVAVVPLQARISSSGPPSLAGFDLDQDRSDGTLGRQYDPFSTRWSQGGSGVSADGVRSADNIYNFGFWQYLDVSYYFGHQLVAPPPTMWTNAAHANGVLSLGTFNLNRPGATEILNPDTYRSLADTLAEFARYYRFDGFVVNYEPGEIAGQDDQTIDPEVMLALLARLHESGLTVVWYDSELSVGDAPYANYLNPEAVDFLLAAGTFHTNYWWGDDSRGGEIITPEWSYRTLEEFRPDQAEVLRNQVYSALDPYRHRQEDGRGPWKPGSEFFQTMRSVLSPSAPGGYWTGVGLFAPNWTYYDGLNLTQPPRPRLEAQRRDQAFWAGTGSYTTQIPDFDPSQSVAGTVSPRSVVASAPFSTDFNTGQGSFFNVGGVRAATGAWSNLSTQSILPTERFTTLSTNTAQATIELQYEDAYNGGSSLVIAAPRLLRGSVAGFKLYTSEIDASAVDRITFTVKALDRTVWPTIQAWLDLGHGETASLSGVVTERAGGWSTLSFAVPSSLDGRTIEALGLNVIGTTTWPSPLKLAIGRMQVLPVDGGRAAEPVLISLAPDARLDWSSQYRASSTYRIYGEIAGRYYLVGVTRGSSYATQGIILNRDVNGYTGYVVQEIDASGMASPLPGPLARNHGAVV